MWAYYANMKTPGIITKIAKEADVYGNKKNKWGAFRIPDRKEKRGAQN